MSTRKFGRTALIAVLALSIIMSITGGTIAWFTDEVTSANNMITAGNLDVDVYYGDAAAQNSIQNVSELFKDVSRWEPGAVAWENLTVVNKGNLALKYEMTMNATNENTVNGNGLSTALQVGIVEGGVKSTNREEVLGKVTQWVDFADFKAAGSIEAGAADDVYGIVVYWAPKANDNDWNVNNGKKTDDNKDQLTIDLGVKLVATQLTAEEDAFDDQYDAGAAVKLPVNTMLDLKNAVKGANDGDIIVFGADIEDDDGILIENKNITIDLNGKTFTTSVGASTSSRNFKITGDSQVTIKNGTLIAEGDMTSGAYGTVRTEDTAKVTLNNVKLYSYRGYGLNVKAASGTTVTINNSEIYAQYGGGVEAAGGTIVLNNTKIDQQGVYSGAAWCSVAIGVNGGGKAIVNSGDYSASAIATDSNAAQGTWVAYVMSSGGDLIINGGTFNGKVAETADAANACGVICADRAAVVEINGGTFNSNGAILDMRNNVGTLPNPVATLKGGTYSADPTVSGLYSSDLIKVADGYAVTKNSNGTWTVAEPVNPWYDVYEVKDGDNIVITSGTADEYAEIAHSGGDLTIKNVTFKNGLTIYTNNTANNGTVILENCIINLNDGTGDPAHTSRTQHKNGYGVNLNLANGSDLTIEFKNCKFTAADDYTYNGNNSYNVYIGGGYSADSITFTGCTFEKSGKHAIGCSSEGSSQYYKLSVTGCNFANWNNDTAITNGAAIRGNLPSATFAADITISGNTFGNNNDSTQNTVAIDSWNGTWN